MAKLTLRLEPHTKARKSARERARSQAAKPQWLRYILLVAYGACNVRSSEKDPRKMIFGNLQDEQGGLVL